jgi:hypothetical protein
MEFHYGANPNFWQSFLSTLLPALAGLLGVAVGAWLTARREHTRRKLDFIETRLKEFYSPMLGLRTEILAFSDVRLKIQNATHKDLARLSADDSASGMRKLEAAMKADKHEQQIEYNNEQLRKQLIPGYRKMVDLFRDKYWLADTDTKEFYPKLVEYVEIWNRNEANSMPVGVLKLLNYEEANLHPFYEHLQQRHDDLRQKIEDGKP